MQRINVNNNVQTVELGALMLTFIHYTK